MEKQHIHARPGGSGVAAVSRSLLIQEYQNLVKMKEELAATLGVMSWHTRR
jgi:hypothetical protein